MPFGEWLKQTLEPQFDPVAAHRIRFGASMDDTALREQMAKDAIDQAGRRLLKSVGSGVKDVLRSASGPTPAEVGAESAVAPHPMMDEWAIKPKLGMSGLGVQATRGGFRGAITANPLDLGADASLSLPLGGGTLGVTAGAQFEDQPGWRLGFGYRRQF